MKQNHCWAVLLTIALLIPSLLVGQESSSAYARRSYQLGAKLHDVIAIQFPDEKDWPGAQLFLSSEHPFKTGADSWVPIKDIRASLPFTFTDEELEGPPPVKVKGQVSQVQPPQAYLPTVLFYGKWADCGVIKGEFYYPSISRGNRVDGKPQIHYLDAALWLGDVWNKTSLYFYQPESAQEPVLFYIETTGSSRDFDRLKALFQQTYGEPSSISDEVVQNGMGASFDNEVIEYKNSVSSMILRKYADDLDTGSLVHIYWPVYKELESKLKEKDREAAGKL